MKADITLFQVLFCVIYICTKYQRHGRVKFSMAQIHAFQKKKEENHPLITETQCVLYNVRMKAMRRSF